MTRKSFFTWNSLENVLICPVQISFYCCEFIRLCNLLVIHGRFIDRLE